MEEKSCKNCKYFAQFYLKGATSFYKVNYGDCKTKYINAKERRSFPFANGCELWQPLELTEEERKVRITEVIRNMNEKLAEIAALLKNEE